jgi:type II secretory pathway pseudopilin PulG
MASRANTAILAATVLLTLVSSGAWANTLDEKASCKSFAQSFYDWYVKAGSKDSVASALEIAIKKRPNDFSPLLRTGLKADIDASAKSRDGVVGLDFDPILASQLDPEPYHVGKVTQNGVVYRAEVYSRVDGKLSKTPHVYPELKEVGGHWQFVNFHYKDGGKDDNLLSILKSLADDRKKYSNKG